MPRRSFLAAALVIWAAASAHGVEGATTGARATAGAPRPWTFDDVLALRIASEPRLSADGRRIVYVVNEITADSSRFQSDVWLGMIATGEQRRLTSSAANDMSPRWSPDGRAVAFLSDRPAQDGGQPAAPQVWMLPLDGGEPAPLTSAPSGVMSFEWSADGRSLVYLAPEGATAAGLARAARRDDSRVTSEHPGFTRVWLLDVAARKATPITPADGFVSGFTLSPDGRRLVYAAQREPGPNGVYDSDLWAIAVTGGKPAPLVQRPGMDHVPHFSPDGRWIAFVSQDGVAGGSGSRVAVCIVPAAGGSVVDITRGMDERICGPGIAAEPMWMPDNESVLFGANDRTNIRIFRAFTDDRPVEPVTREQGVSDWPAMDAAGKVLAWTHEDSTHPVEVWVWEFERSAPRAFTDLNPWTRERHSFPAQVVTWPGADGQQVEGLLYAPLQSRPGTRAPLLLVAHGGPGAAHTQCFAPMAEGYGIPVYLQRGWAVLMPNPRGSTGYGGAWRAGNLRDWGGTPYSDLMSGVDAMIRLGLADSTRLAVCGWSYGGYMTANIVGRTNRFRAAVAGGGPADLMSFAGTSDIPSLARFYMGAWPWEDPQVYLENSPLMRVASVRTPTAFIHGENDTRVDASQSREMHRALQTLGVPTDLMTLPREAHGPAEPRHIRAMMEFNYEWLARWTLGAPPAGARRATGGTR